MRLLITENPNQEFNGTILSPEKGDNFQDLDKYVDHNECEDIVFTLTDYIGNSQLAEVIKKLSTKLAHKGKLTIVGSDAIIVSKALYHGSINILKFNELVYGSRDRVWAFKQGLVTLNDIVEILKLQKLKITKKRISDFTYSVTGERE